MKRLAACLLSLSLASGPALATGHRVAVEEIPTARVQANAVATYAIWFQDSSLHLANLPRLQTSIWASVGQPLLALPASLPAAAAPAAEEAAPAPAQTFTVAPRADLGTGHEAFSTRWLSPQTNESLAGEESRAFTISQAPGAPGAPASLAHASVIAGQGFDQSGPWTATIDAGFSAPAPEAPAPVELLVKPRSRNPRELPDLRSSLELALEEYPSQGFAFRAGIASPEHRAQFRGAIIEASGLPAHDAAGQFKDREELFEEAIKQWSGPYFVLHPFQPSECAFGHELWVASFHLIHPERNTRIELGPEEVFRFGVLDQGSWKRLFWDHVSQTRSANDSRPALRPVMSRLKELQAKFPNGSDRQKLLALSKIAAIHAGYGLSYYELVDVMDQHIVRRRKAEPLITERDLARYAEALGLPERPALSPYFTLEATPAQEYTHALVAAAPPALEQSPSGQTEAQRLRLAIAGAQQAEERSEEAGRAAWGKIAAWYSSILENISAFTIKVGAFVRFFSILRSLKYPGAKPPAELKSWLFLGAGPAIGVRALAKLVSLKGKTLRDLDYTQEMRIEASKAVAGLGDGVDYNYYDEASPDPLRGLHNILSRPFPLPENSQDVVETGMLEKIKDTDQLIHFLLEINRVLDKGGYLILTLKHGEVPPHFRETLKEHFGLAVLNDPRDGLAYSKGVLDAMTYGDAKKAQRLKAHLAEGSVLIAVKDRTVSLEAVYSARGAVRQGLAFPKTEKKEPGESGRAPAAPPEDVILKDLDYAPLKERIVPTEPPPPPPAKTGDRVPKKLLLADHHGLEAQLDHLYRVIPLLEYETSRKRARELILQWFDPATADFLPQELTWLREVHHHFVSSERNIMLSRPRVSRALPHVYSQIDELQAIARRLPPAEKTALEQDLIQIRHGLLTVGLAAYELERFMELYRRYHGWTLPQAEKAYQEIYGLRGSSHGVPQPTLHTHLEFILQNHPNAQNRALARIYLLRADNRGWHWLRRELFWVLGSMLEITEGNP